MDQSDNQAAPPLPARDYQDRARLHIEHQQQQHQHHHRGHQHHHHRRNEHEHEPNREPAAARNLNLNPLSLAVATSITSTPLSAHNINPPDSSPLPQSPNQEVHREHTNANRGHAHRHRQGSHSHASSENLSSHTSSSASTSSQRSYDTPPKEERNASGSGDGSNTGTVTGESGSGDTIRLAPQPQPQPQSSQPNLSAAQSASPLPNAEEPKKKHRGTFGKLFAGLFRSNSHPHTQATASAEQMGPTSTPHTSTPSPVASASLMCTPAFNKQTSCPPLPSPHCVPVCVAPSTRTLSPPPPHATATPPTTPSTHTPAASPLPLSSMSSRATCNSSSSLSASAQGQCISSAASASANAGCVSVSIVPPHPPPHARALPREPQAHAHTQLNPLFVHAIDRSQALAHAPSPPPPHSHSSATSTSPGPCAPPPAGVCAGARVPQLPQLPSAPLSLQPPPQQQPFMAPLSISMDMALGVTDDQMNRYLGLDADEDDEALAAFVSRTQHQHTRDVVGGPQAGAVAASASTSAAFSSVLFQPNPITLYEIKMRASRQAERHAALKRRFDAECGVLERLRADVRRMERDAAALVSAAEEFPTHLDVAEKLEENRELTVEFYLTALELADLSERFGFASHSAAATNIMRGPPSAYRGIGEIPDSRAIVQHSECFSTATANRIGTVDYSDYSVERWVNEVANLNAALRTAAPSRLNERSNDPLLAVTAAATCTATTADARPSASTSAVVANTLNAFFGVCVDELASTGSPYQSNGSSRTTGSSSGAAIDGDPRAASTWARVGPGPGAGDVGDGDGEVGGLKWACARCTFLNHPALPDCELCAAPRPLLPFAPNQQNQLHSSAASIGPNPIPQTPHPTPI